MHVAVGQKPAETGVIVRSVRPGSPAAKAGLRRGDLVRKLDHRVIRNLADFDEAAWATVDPAQSIRCSSSAAEPRRTSSSCTSAENARLARMRRGGDEAMVTVTNNFELQGCVHGRLPSGRTRNRPSFALPLSPIIR